MRVVLIGVLFLLSALVPSMASNSSGPKFTPLSSEETARLNEQRTFVAAFLNQHFPGLHLTRTKADFAVLQKVVDSKLIKPNETWKLQSLGVAYGDALVSYIEGLSWCDVTDEYGTDPTLRYRETTLQANALTMVSKRVEDGREIDLQEMADWLKKAIPEKSSKAD
jgi:hypothetical protein